MTCILFFYFLRQYRLLFQKSLFNAYIKNSVSKQQLIILSLITLIIGGGIELIQSFFSRSAQLGDLYYNLLGSFGAYLFWQF